MKIETWLNNYIHKNIPITKALGATITSANTEKVIVRAPFLNNINHQSTVFGGSLHAIATLAGWALLYINLMERQEKIEIVIQKSEVHYLKPVTEDFEAISTKPELVNWNIFKKILNKKQKGRISIRSQIYQNNILAVNYEGIFAVLIK